MIHGNRKPHLRFVRMSGKPFLAVSYKVEVRFAPLSTIGNPFEIRPALAKARLMWPWA